MMDVLLCKMYDLLLIRGLVMNISYDLWKTLIDKRMNKTELGKKTGISSSTIAKMTRGDPWP